MSSFFLLVSLLALSWSGCKSSAQFAVCGNGDWEPTEACELDQYDADDAAAACRDAGYAGGSATCLPDSCTWDLTSCTGTVNNVNNNNLLCDPLTGGSAGCESDQTCFYEPNASTLFCAVSQEGSLGGTCLTSDECLPQHVCLDSICQRMCSVDAGGCALELPCDKKYWLVDEWGTCPLVDIGCDIFNGIGCPGEDDSCYIVVDYQYMEVHLACLYSGSGTGTCTGESFNECAPGLICWEGNCRFLCDDDHSCLDGECNNLSVQIGVCL
ncbi:MAG: hypothetical protein CVU59_07935 [Deltaproteobacteria bacterium HGW-Deltaproteobacteria-17]|nr:MAG: hypothetical protein CVU59_07935 [Deltaproteobacteria bacterium HGW-Deltaproteobacteria-17]